MKPISALIHDISELQKKTEELQKKMPRVVGKLGVDAMKRNFVLQGFVGMGTFTQWKDRSQYTNTIYDNRVKYNLKGSVYNSKNPILTQTGNLKSSLTYRINDNEINIGCNLNQIPYAKINNEGGAKKFGNKWVRIPKRQFLGMSRYLSNQIKQYHLKEIGKIFKKFKK